MMEKMLRDANMQKMLYPYLPEPMRNPESIEWMLNNPEVRKQMEQVFAQSVSRTAQHTTARRGMAALSASSFSHHCTLPLDQCSCRQPDQSPSAMCRMGWVT